MAGKYKIFTVKIRILLMKIKSRYHAMKKNVFDSNNFPDLWQPWETINNNKLINNK